MSSSSISGNLADVHLQKIYAATITVENGIITAIEKTSDEADPSSDFMLPGFIDSHVHIESSMLVPSEFARMAVVHGTVATISDPHEIANVCGMEGVEFMIENGKTVPFKFNFGAPSCVPATVFETAGATLDVKDVTSLLKRKEIKYLSEMMNFPGVLFQDKDVMQKIAAAHKQNKPVDGHAPGLRGEQAKQYIAAGISTDHECFTYEEALEKLQYGMKIIIREGSAAKNFEALIELLNDWPEMMMFCSDDKHPDSLVLGHINQLCARAVAKGIDLFKVLKAACVNPVMHYKLDVGLLRKGDAADFIVVKDLKKFEVVKTYINGALVAEEGRSLFKTSRSEIINNFSCSKKSAADFIVVKDLKKFEVVKTYINGVLVAEEGRSLIKTSRSEIINNFSCSKKSAADFALPWNGKNENPVIEALDGQLITNKLSVKPKVVDNYIVSDVANDILKIAVVNRYQSAPVASSLIKNFGLKKGAIASSVAHDSHNIVAVGVDDESICHAVNLVIEHKGGISCVCPAAPNGSWTEMALPLPVAGLMSNEDGYMIAAQYEQLDRMAKVELGATLASPYMTLSFMALLVIPHLKLSDKGLFDGDRFEFVQP